MAPRTGGLFTLPTDDGYNVSESLSAGEPSSVNDKSNVVVACIIQTPGVQLNTLVDGLKLAPVGTLLALKARPSPSGSLAVAVKVRKSTFIYAPGTDRTEHRRPVHIAHREMVTVSESLSAGLPSSVTVNVTL